MTAPEPVIYYTKTDEAPALATISLLPILKAFAAPAGIKLELCDISLAGRILAQFPDLLGDEKAVSDDLTFLGNLAKKPEANIIKLPNISASIPQLTAAIKELQKLGFKIPDYPVEPANEKELEIQQRYAKVLGSAVNPVLREGNSNRRVAAPVKEFAKKHPHSMGDWSKDSKCHLSHMHQGDFLASEKSVIIEKAGPVKIIFTDKNGNKKVLKDNLKLQENELIDGSFMSVKALRNFIDDQIKDSIEKDVLFSLHLKATMMKISDPIIFGHVVSVFFKDVFEKHAAVFEKLGIDPNHGMGELYTKIEELPDNKKQEIKSDISDLMKKRPKLAMVNSDKGITNLHVPSDVIIDASMPAAIRAGGKMWGPDGELHDMKAIIPDRCYARIYEATIDFCRENGAFDPRTMGSVSNIGLMAQKAEEYGSHDKTFEIQDDGVVEVVDADNNVLMEHKVEKGDIWRACQTKDLPIQDWVKLAVKRARITGSPAIFWLNEERAHDQNLIGQVKKYLKDHDTEGLDIRILSPRDAIAVSLKRAREGKDTISVTGNVLRDYLTDLFPILELGTSAKMLSIVPLLNGGGLYETGAGGSAPKHIQQFIAEGHLRWDSLGEFLALGVSLEDYGRRYENITATILGKALNKAIGLALENNIAPSRSVGKGIDNRGTHVWLANFWAAKLAEQKDDEKLARRFSGLSQKLSQNIEKIIDEIDVTRGKPQDIGGYYFFDQEKVVRAMRPSQTLNKIIDDFIKG